MPKKKKKVAYCKTCDYIRSHKNNGINADLMGGIPMQAITRRTGLGLTTLKRHRDEGHMMDRFLPAIASTKQARAELDLLKCATEIFMDCKDSAEKAKKKAEEKSGKARDFKDAMGCWDNAVKALGILKPEDKTPITTNINLSDPFTRIQAYEKYFTDMENDAKRESPSSSNDPRKPILQTETNQETSSILGEE